MFGHAIRVVDIGVNQVVVDIHQPNYGAKPIEQVVIGIAGGSLTHKVAFVVACVGDDVAERVFLGPQS